MIPVQISTSLEGKTYTATLRCVLKGKEYIVKTKGIGEPKDSRQRLELLAVLAALSRMVKPSEITIKGRFSVFGCLEESRLEKVKRQAGSE